MKLQESEETTTTRTLNRRETREASVDAVDEFIHHVQEQRAPVNVSKVKHLSVFRYPGGKTWLVPEVKRWVEARRQSESTFIEPFAGGAIAGLSIASEQLVPRVHLCELDEDVSAVWTLIFLGTDSDVDWMCNRIADFVVSPESVKNVLTAAPENLRQLAFRTIIKNRMQRGGIMAPGAGLIKSGEAGRGLMSRWYPETLATRIRYLRTLRERIHFERGDAFSVIRRYLEDPNALFFVDPPYTAGGKRAGKRLYLHNEVDHEALFALLTQVRGSVMMTYDDAPEVRNMARTQGFRVVEVPMKNTHHEIIMELLILKP